MMESEVEFQDFVLLHKPQLLSSHIPESHWNCLWKKLKNEIFDAGTAFSLAQVEELEEEESSEPTYSWQVLVSCNKVEPNDSNQIYLVDHAWSYQIKHAEKQLEEIPNLLERMASLMDIGADENFDKESLKQMVLARMWRYNQTYHFGNATTEDDDSLEPTWYIMDEFGSRIQHSDEPSVQMVPFFYIPAGISFSLMWPTKKLKEGDEVTRDYAAGITDPNTRRARLLPWFDNDLTDIDWKLSQPEDSYFMNYCQGETLPELQSSRPTLPEAEPIKVFTDITQVATFLTDDRFQITSDKDSADILWCKEAFKDFRSMGENSPHRFVNQFPNEMLVTVKDAMAVISRRVTTSSLGHKPRHSLETAPPWLPTTFNLVTELPQFVSYFQQREKQSLDNHWILKPWNMARAVDTHICNDLDTIVRLSESIPKVACKYIEQPVLFHREEIGWVKFDIRYIVLLASTSPLKLYAYRVFWLRFANKVYALDSLDDYEKHFTVMNYKEGVTLKQVHFDEFVPMFEKQYPDFPWKNVEEKIFAMFRELFGAACSKGPPFGIPPSPQSRSMYAVDLMLDWDTTDSGEKVMSPRVCEVNYCPDCERACKYHPHFYNDVFRALFLDDVQDRPVTLL